MSRFPNDCGKPLVVLFGAVVFFWLGRAAERKFSHGNPMMTAQTLEADPLSGSGGKDAAGKSLPELPRGAGFAARRQREAALARLTAAGWKAAWRDRFRQGGDEVWQFAADWAQHDPADALRAAW